MAELPDIARILAPLLQRVKPEQQPLLLASLERMAAERYRGWAERHEDAEVKRGLLTCAAREEQIAAQVEALVPDAQAVQQRILRENPEIAEVNRTLFAGRPLSEQLAIQASGERAGGATWLAFAKASSADEARQAFERCAPLEEENARFLEGLLGKPGH